MAGHPVVAFLAVALIGFVILAALAVLAGWLLETYVLPDHGIGHADEHVNVWLSHHRTAHAERRLVLAVRASATSTPSRRSSR